MADKLPVADLAALGRKAVDGARGPALAWVGANVVAYEAIRALPLPPLPPLADLGGAAGEAASRARTEYARLVQAGGEAADRVGGELAGRFGRKPAA